MGPSSSDLLAIENLNKKETHFLGDKELIAMSVDLKILCHESTGSGTE